MRPRLVMYEQQIERLPFKGGVKELESRIRKLSVKRYAIIVHDRDVDKDKNQIKSHVHAMIELNKKQLLSSIAKTIGDTPQQFENMGKRGKNGADNGFAYLIHATKGAKEKYQYDMNDVIANFDYVKFMTDMIKSVKKHSKEDAESILNNLATGQLTKKEAKQELMNVGAMEYAENIRKLNDVAAGRLDIDVANWQSMMIKQGKKKKIIWLYGGAGLGKTRLAKVFADFDKGDCFVAGGSNDMYQDYSGESNLILEELRPNVIQYSDLLRQLDPYDFSTTTTARYHNANLKAEKIIVTTPFSPLSFYEGQKNLNKYIDSYDQLNRRISTIIHVTEKKLIRQKYNPEKATYNAANDCDNPFAKNSKSNILALDKLMGDKKDVKKDKDD